MNPHLLAVTGLVYVTTFLFFGVIGLLIMMINEALNTKGVNWDLDVVLTFLVNKNTDFDQDDDIHQAVYWYRMNRKMKTNGEWTVTDHEIEYQRAVFRKLSNDGYVDDRTNDVIPRDRTNDIVPTIEGRIFHSSPIGLFRDRPFAYERLKKNLQTVWNIAKIIAVVLNALAIIYIGYIAAHK